MTPGQRWVVAWLIVLLVVVWSCLWKGIALWKAARRDQIGWYVVLLLAPLFGALEMFYVFVVAPRHAEVGEPVGPVA
jgi:methionyl-tRNA synthetase